MKTNILLHSFSKNVNCALFLTLLLGITGPLVLPAAGQGVSLLNPLQVALLKWSPNLTTSFTVGSDPVGVAFDGASIWVVNNGPGTVTKLRASDGAVEGTFNVGSGGAGVASGGANISVANN